MDMVQIPAVHFDKVVALLGDFSKPNVNVAAAKQREAGELLEGLAAEPVAPQRPGVREAVSLLRELLKLDYNATAKLVGTYAPTSGAVALHPTVQVGERPEGYILGFIGVLNGLLTLHSNAEGYIGVVLNSDGSLRDFVVLDRTQAQPPAEPQKPDAPILPIQGPPPPPRLLK